MPGLSSKTGRKASRRSRRLMDKHSQRSSHRHSQNSPRALRFLFLSELLEMIFLYLDMQTLLLSRRVCHTWDEVIQGSRKLQQALFYIPDTTIPAEPGRHNPLSIDKLWFNFPGAPMGMRDSMYVAVYGRSRAALFMPRKRGRSDDVYRRPEASWRRMLLRQPPTSCILFWDPDAFYMKNAYVSEEVDAHAK
ncbi:hypothetical protein BO86DRAFT_440521 [Aspergillus japonicus CBS 114.51]|uniref:F-box domain-containing protein n=1 Tax=Aspergillus japonicus CBS 114.51 TaxID=1448312 RepID=A0A8T8XA78_ASPJA|nr:hypothetical protein BO86DRAFT_440521 [Aspergillus japonicus CBS 114.51]RAH85133.1 hypothetical protein BO86DRAFT_440521 [Aspergillus japonicus CBS 114.51]